MPKWMTADEIATRYVVGEARLLAYAERGNLPFRRDAGALYFDESFVARFFRPRGALVVVSRSPDRPCLGVLGMSRLGDPPQGSTAAARSRRNRAVRSAADALPMATGARKAAS